jgi:hypothetical protein
MFKTVDQDAPLFVERVVQKLVKLLLELSAPKANQVPPP